MSDKEKYTEEHYDDFVKLWNDHTLKNSEI